ncbi:hypothetical protein DSECCO2_21650 [anaerobic digester metagenome]
MAEPVLVPYSADFLILSDRPPLRKNYLLSGIIPDTSPAGPDITDFLWFLLWGDHERV